MLAHHCKHDFSVCARLHLVEDLLPEAAGLLEAVHLGLLLIVVPHLVMVEWCNGEMVEWFVVEGRYGLIAKWC